MPPNYTRPTLVERASRPPGKCIVTNDIDGPFIDCGIEFDPAVFSNKNVYSRLYLHAPWVEQVARDSLGMVPRSEIEALEQRAQDAEQDAEAASIALDALVDARERTPA